MTTTHNLAKDMPLERLLNFLSRYAWFRKTASFLGKLVWVFCWGVPMLLMAALVIYGGYKFIHVLSAFANSVASTNF